jgi:hypothetical protein
MLDINFSHTKIKKSRCASGLKLYNKMLKYPFHMSGIKNFVNVITFDKNDKT